MGAEYFLNKGFRHFAFCSLEGYFWSDDRLNSYQTTLEKEGFKIYIYNHPRPNNKNRWQNQPRKIAQWLKHLAKPLAIMAATDELSLQIVEAAKIDGIMIPEEIALLGVDNDDSICSTSYPTLSSIDQNPEWAGFEAAGLLSKMMKGKIKKVINIIAEPLKVITRNSTDVMAIEDKIVASALHFINDHARDKQISVTEIASQSGYVAANA